MCKPSNGNIAEAWSTDKATGDATESRNHVSNRLALVLLESGFV